MRLPIKFYVGIRCAFITEWQIWSSQRLFLTNRSSNTFSIDLTYSLILFLRWFGDHQINRSSNTLSIDLPNSLILFLRRFGDHPIMKRMYKRLTKVGQCNEIKGLMSIHCSLSTIDIRTTAYSRECTNRSSCQQSSGSVGHRESEIRQDG